MYIRLTQLHVETSAKGNGKRAIHINIHITNDITRANHFLELCGSRHHALARRPPCREH